MPKWNSASAISQHHYPFSHRPDARRIFRAYGTRAERIFEGVRSAQDLGENFGLLSAREVDYLMEHEWAHTAEDILWRRSKLGLHLSMAEQAALAAYMAQQAGEKTRKRSVNGLEHDRRKTWSSFRFSEKDHRRKQSEIQPGERALRAFRAKPHAKWED